jgi:hypothetical protein
MVRMARVIEGEFAAPRLQVFDPSEALRHDEIAIEAELLKIRCSGDQPTAPVRSSKFDRRNLETRVGQAVLGHNRDTHPNRRPRRNRRQFPRFGSGAPQATGLGDYGRDLGKAPGRWKPRHQGRAPWIGDS